MRNILTLYAKANIPLEIWIVAIIMAILAIGIAVWRRSQGREWLRPMAIVMLIAYCLVIVCSTVVFRRHGWWYELKLMPFWSYNPAYGGLTKTAIIANLLNVVLYLPIGFLYNCAYRRAHWWTMLTVAFTFSFSIELAQYLIPCGFAEVDDLIHNCIGALIGYGIATFLTKTKRSIAVTKTKTDHC